MLVLTRKSGESLMIGETIVITVIEVRGGQVKIGVEAPREIAVYRKELLEKIRKENVEAGKIQKKDKKITSLAEIILKNKIGK
ncbi:MAG: carbon storage regulator CsrA [Calditrichaeota bacterium]|nr:carbon storage regulator CsrA [Calditrichota bacterium]